ncbi:MAG: membrane protease subunit HflC [Myxococcota bacterium]|jgi:membrane protease subunit HflC
MNQGQAIGALLTFFSLALLASQSLYVVDETEQVVVTQFGKPIGDPVIEPGLKFKIPFIQTVNRFEKRFSEWDGERNQLPTRDKRFIFVDTYARWRISDPLKFFQRLRDERGAQSRLDDILDGETRNVIARHDLIEVVRTSVRDFAVDDEKSGGLTDSDSSTESGDFKITSGREELAGEVLVAAQSRTADLGIEILDFQFKRINYVEAVQAEVYTRMISERKRIAEQFRSEGIGEAARINGEKEWELARITSEAFRRTEEIRGDADAEAARIYAKAYNEDPELYAFLKSMETYQSTVDDQTTLILGTSGEFLHYLEDAGP